MDAAIWPNPCGQVVDVLRSCYETGMVFVDGGPTVQVKWFRADPGAKYIGVATPFASTNWQDAKSKYADLGEQPGPRPWRNGAGPTALKGQPTCPKDRAMEGIGIPYDPPRPLSSEGQPLCCGPVPPPPFDCVTLPDLKATFEGQTGCGTINGVLPLTRPVPGLCNWTGTKPTWLGDAEVTLAFDGIDWTFTIDCFAGQPTIVFVSFVESPFAVVFDVTDTTACCSFAGTDSFRVTIQPA